MSWFAITKLSGNDLKALHSICNPDIDPDVLSLAEMRSNLWIDIKPFFQHDVLKLHNNMFTTKLTALTPSPLQVVV